MSADAVGDNLGDHAHNMAPLSQMFFGAWMKMALSVTRVLDRLPFVPSPIKNFLELSMNVVESEEAYYLWDDFHSIDYSLKG